MRRQPFLSQPDGVKKSVLYVVMIVYCSQRGRGQLRRRSWSIEGGIGGSDVERLGREQILVWARMRMRDDGGGFLARAMQGLNCEKRNLRVNTVRSKQVDEV